MAETRTVSRKTATVSLYGNRYEVDRRAGLATCELIFDPFDLTKIEVRYKNEALGHAVPLRSRAMFIRKASTSSRRRPRASGIDYLACSPPSVERELAGQPDRLRRARRREVERDRESTNTDID